jgi:hypothetical protein
MTVSLSYDAALARVRISADWLAAANYATIERSTDQIVWTTVRGGAAAVPGPVVSATDDFTRTASGTWGTAPTGQAWDVAANTSVNGSQGLLTHVAVNTFLETHIDVSYSDFDMYVDLDPIVSTGAGSGAYGIRARILTDGSGDDFIEARVFDNPGSPYTVGVREVIDSVQTQFDPTFPSVPGVAAGGVIRLRLQAIGPVVRMKAYAPASPEPGTWLSQLTTINRVDGGRIAFNSSVPVGWTNPPPFSTGWDNLSIANYQLAVDDYEFVPGVVNYYRVRGIETGVIQYVGAGTVMGGDNSSLTPPHPSGPGVVLLPGDLKLIPASIRNSGTGTVNVPAGWTVMRQYGNVSILGRRHVTGDVPPTVTFTGGVVGATTLAFMTAWRRADLTPATAADQLNGSASTIAYPALTVPQDNQAILWAGWRQDDWGGAPTPPPGSSISVEIATPTGDDAAMVLYYLIQTAKANIAAGSINIVGAAAISRAAVVALQHAPFLNEQTASITPVLDRIWLKSVQRPFLNRAVTVVEWSEEERPARAAGFPVVGRTLEIGVTDVSGGIQFVLDLHVSNRQDAQTLDYIRASGDILYLHLPAGCEIPGGHVCLDTSSSRRPRPRGSSRVFSLPLRQCAAPGPDVVGTTVTWQSVLNLYPSWAALLAANPTWADLLARIAPPSEVIVP